MRVCTAAQMAAIDRDTIAGGVPGIELMERAGAVVAEVVLEQLSATAHPDNHGDDHGHDHDDDHGCDHGEAGDRVLVLCGKGNNGGDGLVAARLLAAEGALVVVLLLAEVADLSPNAATNLNRLPATVQVVTPGREAWIATVEEELAAADLVVDAVFGTGITPPLRSPYPEIFRAVNDAGLPCVAADIPSGVGGDDGRVAPVAIAADVTVTMGLPKRGLLLPPGRDFAGEIVVADIGFPDDVCARHAPDHHWLADEDYLELLPPRPTDTHKYRCGTLLVLAGSRTYGGAAHLAGMGALRSGAGLVTLAAPRCLETALRVGLPEVIVAPLAETPNGTIAPLDAAALAPLLDRRGALAVGPGLGADPDTDAWIVEMLATAALPLVVDADALSAFARTGETPRFAHTEVILTPHAGELARLTGLTADEIASRRFEVAADCAARWRCVLLLKGSPTLVAMPDGRVHINGTGDDALARGGSGDVLTGLLAGLLAQGLGAGEAALLGAHVHGRAGTLAASGRSTRGVLVREIADAIGPVFEAMEKEASADAALRERIWPTGDATC